MNLPLLVADVVLLVILCEDEADRRRSDVVGCETLTNAREIGLPVTVCLRIEMDADLITPCVRLFWRETMINQSIFLFPLFFFCK